ncbi:hypothetical protein ACFVZL_40395 [Streptomyces sp. NPDC058320]|uniref:hypothetical protein n=1 Tax=unclassified Streptomyces TaxID=2593676 RepID=UPI003628CE53
MDLTTWLAVLGFVTGVVGLVWQISTHWLTGRRLQVLALRKQSEGEWLVQTSVLNVGRLDETIQNYSVWGDFTGRRVRRLRWRLRTIRQLGWSHAWRTQVTFAPSLTVGAPGGFSDDSTHVQFPFVLKAGEKYTFPTLRVTVPRSTDRSLKVSVGRGVGRPVVGKVADVAQVEAHNIDVPEESGWGWSVGHLWSHPAFAPMNDDVPGSVVLTEIVHKADDMLADLSRVRQSAATDTFAAKLSEFRGQILADRRLPLPRARGLQAALDSAGMLVTVLASGQQLKEAIDAVVARESA